jgi:hypothetical protein
MQLVIHQPAKPGTVFAPDAFERQVGRTVPFKVGDEVVGEARIVSVVVSDDGTDAEITLEASFPEIGKATSLMLLGVPNASFAFREPEQPVDPLLRDFLDRREG